MLDVRVGGDNSCEVSRGHSDPAGSAEGVELRH